MAYARRIEKSKNGHISATDWPKDTMTRWSTLARRTVSAVNISTF